MTDPLLAALAAEAEEHPEDLATLKALADLLGEASGADRLELVRRWIPCRHAPRKYRATRTVEAYHAARADVRQLMGRSLNDELLIALATELERGAWLAVRLSAMKEVEHQHPGSVRMVELRRELTVMSVVRG